MSTRCFIGTRLDIDTYNDNYATTEKDIVTDPNIEIYRVIYVHNDGYIKGGVGECLLRNYKDEYAVDELLDLGDLSSLESSIEMSIAYGRDRNERNTQALIIKGNIEKVCKIAQKSWAEFLYIFDNGKWYWVTEKGKLNELKIRS